MVDDDISVGQVHPIRAVVDQEIALHAIKMRGWIAPLEFGIRGATERETVLAIQDADRILNEHAHQPLQAAAADGFLRLPPVAVALCLLPLKLLEDFVNVLFGLAALGRPLQKEAQKRILARLGVCGAGHTNRIPGRFPVCQVAYAGCALWALTDAA